MRCEIMYLSSRGRVESSNVPHFLIRVGFAKPTSRNNIFCFLLETKIQIAELRFCMEI